MFLQAQAANTTDELCAAFAAAFVVNGSLTEAAASAGVDGLYEKFFVRKGELSATAAAQLEVSSSLHLER